MSTRTGASVDLLILDMDNTLYDWVGYFVPAVEAMLAKAAAILAVPEGQLRDDLRAVHVFRGNTEHPFALLETKTVLARLDAETPPERHRILQPAFEVFDAERRARLTLYPGVREVLEAVRKQGCRVVGHTEATAVNIRSRVRTLALDDLLDAVYAPGFEGPPHPLGYVSPPSDAGSVPRYAEVSARKPAPTVVHQILSDLGVPAERALYVGDSLSNDIRMAKDAGVRAAWARYGADRDPQVWQRLVALSHWQPSAVAAATSGDSARTAVEPDVVLDSFTEVLSRFSFGGSAARPRS